MRKLLLTLVFGLIISLSGYSQYYVDYGFTVGASNYLGEIGGGQGTRKDFVGDIKFDATRWTAGAFFRYRVSPKIGVKASLNYIRISGDDKKNTKSCKAC